MAHVLELFVSSHCPGCPDARRRLQEFATTQPDITVVERNVEEGLEEAARYGLFATPAIVIDGESVLYGVPSLSQLVRRCGLPEPEAECRNPNPALGAPSPEPSG